MPQIPTNLPMGPANPMTQAFSDPAATAKTLAAMGISPSMFAGAGPATAVPGAQYTGGIAGAQGAPNPSAISSANTGLGSLLQQQLGMAPPRTLGALLRGA